MPQDQVFEILLVDDDTTIFDLLSRIGQQQFPQATFSCITSPEETIAYLQNHAARRPQLVLLDVGFQQSTDGLALLPQLYSWFKGQVPIIMLSAIAQEPVVKQAYDAGAVAYTQKPMDLQGWKDYVLRLKKYWYETTLLPPPAMPPILVFKRE